MKKIDKLNGDLRTWLENRCIDTDRRNSRLLRKILGVNTINKVKIALFVHGHTLTDNYWIRTPQLTLGGSFEKGWKLEAGEWFLVKEGNSLTNSAEIIASELCKYFCFKAVEYLKYDDTCVCCKNFTNDLRYNFEPMSDFLGFEYDLEVALDYISQIDINYIKDFLDMLFLDALLVNPDRHTNNYGFLRDSNTGEFIGLAPIFDNNLALFATKSNIIDLNSGNFEEIEKLYLPVLKAHKYSMPCLEYENLKEIVRFAYEQFKPKNYSVEFTTDFIWNKYNFIKKNL
ncbi:hypothetical protein ACSXCO_14855 (plasmid) [Clostridium perfringens]